MKHWPTVPFAEVVDILDSRRVPVNSTERSKRQGSIPYYGATGQTGVIDDFLFDEELVLLGEDGAPFLESGKAKAYLIRGKSWVNNHAHVLRGKPGLLNTFLLYQLNNLDYRPYVSGTTRLKLPQGAMKQIPLLVPPIDDQRRIVAEIEKQFTRLEAGVAALRRVQANLKRYRAAVLKAACEGRLVPTEAELSRSGVPPLNPDSTAKPDSSKSGTKVSTSPKRQDAASTFESGQQLLARILTERRQNWQGRGKYKEPASLGASGYEPESLPEGWGGGTVEQLNQSNRPCAYGVLQPGEDLKDGVPFVRVGDINDGKVSQDAMKRIAPAIAAQYPRTKLHGGELAITLVGAIGRTAVIPDSLAGGNTARAVGIIPLTKLVNPHWVEIWFRNPAKVAEMTGKSHEVARKTLNLEDVRAASVALPPLAEQTRIVAEVERRLSVVEELEAVVTTNLQRATRLRQAVLQKAFTGELSK